MNRILTSLCLSLSSLALGLAVYSLSRDGSSTQSPGSPTEEELLQMHSRLTSLQARVDELVAQQEQQAVDRSDKSRNLQPGDATEAPGETVELQETVETLATRIAELEKEDTIARLARAGDLRLKDKQFKSAISTVLDDDATPADRVESFRTLRKSLKTNYGSIKAALEEAEIDYHDLALPMLDIVQDTGLEAEIRAKSLAQISDLRQEELRQPLLDLLAYDESPEVRAQAVRALMSHSDDVTVQEAILRVSQQDRHDSVQQTAQRRLPRLRGAARHFTPESAAAQLDKSTVDGIAENARRAVKR